MRIATIAIIAGLTWGSPALAQELVQYSGGALLSAADVPSWSDRGFGNPSVVWDADASEWVMFFEVRFAQDALGDATLGLDNDYSGCTVPNGNQIVWGVGRATSADGLEWSLHTDDAGDTVPVFVPPGGGDADINCQVAQPDVALDADGTWHMWFKAVNGTPQSVTGIGYATSSDGITWDYDRLVFEGTYFGFPKVARWQEGSRGEVQWAVYFTQDNVTGGSVETSLFTEPGADLESVGAIPRELSYGNYYNAAVACQAADGAYPLRVFVGTVEADNTDGTYMILDSRDGVRWIGGPPFLTYTGPVPWRQWDSVGLDDGSQLLFSARQNEGAGLNEIYLARLGEGLPDDAFAFTGAETVDICVRDAASACESFEADVDEPDEACCTERPYFPGCVDVCEEGASEACCAEDPTVDGCKAFLDCVDDPDQRGCECNDGDEDVWAFCAPETDTGCTCSSDLSPALAWPFLGGLLALVWRRRRS